MRQVDEFRESFELFDTSGDGSIDSAELAHLMRAFGQDLDEHELQEMIDEVDDDGSGEIEFDEFVHMIVLRIERAMMNDTAQVKKAFEVFDEEAKGYVTTPDLQKALNKRTGKTISMAEANDMITKADKDGD